MDDLSISMTEAPNPLAVPENPPHPVAYMRVRKQVWREWLAKGGVMTIAIDNIPNQAAASPTTVSATITVSPAGLPKPYTMTVTCGPPYVIQTVAVNQLTGRLTTTFPGGRLTPGPCRAKVISPVSPDQNVSNVFTVT